MRTPLLFSLLMLWACEGEMGPGKVTEHPGVYVQQMPGCLANTKMTQSVLSDTCFSYSFDDTLVMNFCFTGNCCPDTNRFTGSVVVAGNTINIAVIDTAEQLCRCICPYLVKFQISELNMSEYTVICSDGNLNYSEKVIRNH